MTSIQWPPTQRLRGSRPDAVNDQHLVLFKKVSRLDLTYQIKLLTFMAERDGRMLLILVPSTAAIGERLMAFISAHQGRIAIERL